MVNAAVGLAALVIWPGGAWRRGLSVPWGLRPAVSAVAAGILTGLLAWFLVEMVAKGGQVGLAERIMGVAQAGWPLAVVLSGQVLAACAAANEPAASEVIRELGRDCRLVRNRGELMIVPAGVTKAPA